MHYFKKHSFQYVLCDCKIADTDSVMMALMLMRVNEAGFNECFANLNIFALVITFSILKQHPKANHWKQHKMLFYMHPFNSGFYLLCCRYKRQGVTLLISSTK